jgi:hypothetical protein
MGFATGIGGNWNAFLCEPTIFAHSLRGFGSDKRDNRGRATKLVGQALTRKVKIDFEQRRI